MIQIGNGNWAVKEDNLLGFRYDETEGVYFPREMTFGRACDATRVNPDGLIERVPYNLLQQSNSFNTTWTKLNAPTITSGQSGYDGSSDAWLLESTSSGTSVLNQNINSSGYQTFSVYAKAGTANFLAFYNSAAITAFFNLSSGSVGTNNSISATIESIGGGWYRCSMAYNASITYTRIYVTDADNNYNSAIGSNIYIQDAQLNEGTIKPYFPTTNRQDIARIDYSSGTGALLLEPQRTNLVLYSEQFDTWTNTEGTTITTNSTISPDGTTSADLLVPTTANNYHRILKSNSVSSSTAYTFTCYVKPNGYNYFLIRVSLLGNVNVAFDLSNGTSTWASSGYTAFISEAGNGWYRVGYTTTTTTTAITNYLRFQPTQTTDDTIYQFVGNGTSGGYCWGAQLEASSYPTSYIPTTSATVTRLADSCYKTGVADWIGQTEGTLFADFVFDGLGTEQRLGISDGTSANYNNIRITTGGTLYVLGAASSVLQYEINCASLSIGNRYKVALAYKQNDIIVYLNGSNVGSDNSATIGACSRFGFDNRDATSVPFRSPINHATIYKTRLSNSELAALTTI